MDDNKRKEPGNLPLSIFLVLALFISIAIFIYAFYTQAKPRNVGTDDVKDVIYLGGEIYDEQK